MQIRSPAILLLSLLSASAFAQNTTLDRLRQRDERERTEQEILRQLQEQQERERAAQEAPETPAPPVLDLGGHAFHIDRIVLDGERRPPRSRRAILARYAGRTLGADDMFALVRDLTNDYGAQGYATTTVALAPQNLKSGILVVKVQWGRVKGWRFDGASADTLSERANRAMLPRVDGKILDVAAVDQAIEVLNNGRQSATVNITPADETGWSWLDVSLKPNRRLGGNFGLDNSGTAPDENEGRFRNTAGLSLRGFGAETWNLGGTRRHFYNGSGDLETSHNVSVAMPLGFSDLELRYGASEYEREIRTIFGSYASEGDSNDWNLKLGRTVARSKRGKTDASLRVTRKDNENFVQGTRTDVNSKVYADVILGLARVDRLLGGSLYADFNWSRGTRWLGANDVVMDPRSGDTKALYYKYSGNLSWNRGFAAGARRLDYAARMGWQYTPRKLLSANKLSIGDEFTVRGFKGTPAYGDKGVYLSNTVSTPLPLGFQAFVGFDIGLVSDNVPGVHSDILSGWAVGFRGQWKFGSLGVTWAEPIRTPFPSARDGVLYATASIRL